MPPDLTSLHRVRELCLPAVEAELKRYLDSQDALGISHNTQMALYHLGTGGKRLRALIPCWVYAAEGKNPLDAVALGTAIELIHNATLVHDDLQDGDQVRRGKSTVWKKYSPAQAINCGDAMFHFGLGLVNTIAMPAERKIQVLQRTMQATLEVIEGQAQEFLMKEEAYPRLARYRGVIRGKTAALISLPVLAAYEALGFSPGEIESLIGPSIQCGMLFQIQDDLLDIYGEKKRDQVASDLAEGKVSFLIAHLNEVATGGDRETVHEVLRLPREQTNAEQIGRVLKIFEKYCCKEAAVAELLKIRSEVRAAVTSSKTLRAKPLLEEMIELFLEPVRHLLS